MEDFQDQSYYIKDIADITGLSEQLIRKWENRYAIIHPKRLDNGYRVYTEADLRVLQYVKALRDQGKSMKDALKIMAVDHKTARQQDETPQAEKSPCVSKLIRRGAIYDEEGLMTLLTRANHQYGLDLFLQNTVQPFLKEVGELWQKGIWDESQETVSSLVVKDFLTQISRNFANSSQSPHVLGFCLPNETHEIPLQMLLLQLEIRGWRTTRIGASPKFSAIEQLIRHIQPKIVLLSAATTIPFKSDQHLFENLDHIARRYPHISFYIGGHGVWDYTEIVKPRYMQVAYSIDDIR
ncbi:hypothetical protein GCM10028778_15970 [Barrientosiimonas marina]|uniref:MerR family transcriptional regulator n=1 Tax=Lentibacillus kimchii TaxID=1542911 RepID=A0ABW2UVK0_9BACI